MTTMLARIWWKEARQFWPILAILAVAALLVQWLAIFFLGNDVRKGQLFYMAFGWTCLYAFEVAAAALAGEKENRTMTFLDTLPVDRAKLWIGKGTFAVVTTFALLLLLLGVAAMGTETWGEATKPWWMLIKGNVLLLAILGLGLFWSAIVDNTIVAAVLGVVTALAIPSFAANNEDALVYISLAAAILGPLASYIFFVRAGQPRRTLLLPARPAERPDTIEPVSATATAAAEPKRLRYWPGALRSLVWITWRDLRAAVGWLFLTAVLGPFVLMFGVRQANDFPMVWSGACLAMTLFAGVLIFGSARQQKTKAFMAHHGARPSLVWAVKLFFWVPVVFGLWALSVLLNGPSLQINGPTVDTSLPVFISMAVPAIITVIGTPLAVAALCGMAIPRGITAALVAFLGTVLLGGVLAAFFANGMITPFFTMLPALGLILVTWLWSPDWLLNRSTWKAWGKLAGLTVGVLGLIFAWYATDRATSIPAMEITPDHRAKIFDLENPSRLAAVPDSENAAELYRKAADAYRMAHAKSGVRQSDGLMDPAAQAEEKQLKAQALELTRSAAAMPRCQFVTADKLNAFTPYQDSLPYSLGPLVRESVEARIANGDLSGAWEDLLVLFRMARHWSEAAPTYIATHYGHNAEWQGLVTAMAWAANEKQTEASLQKALNDFRELPSMPAFADALRVDAKMVQNTLALPRSELVDRLNDQLNSRRDPNARPNYGTAVAIDAWTTPWEITRARRYFDLLYTSRILAAQAPSWYAKNAGGSWGPVLNMVALTEEPAQRILSAGEIEHLSMSTPLSNYLDPSRLFGGQDPRRNKVLGEALFQILALRIYQLRHDGQLPDQLQELVDTKILSPNGVEPGYPSELPMDPYSEWRHPFGYRVASGQMVLPLGTLATPGQVTASESKKVIRPIGGRLLYSIGPDLKDDGGADYLLDRGNGDMVFFLTDPTVRYEKEPTPEPEVPEPEAMGMAGMMKEVEKPDEEPAPMPDAETPPAETPPTPDEKAEALDAKAETPKPPVE